MYNEVLNRLFFLLLISLMSTASLIAQRSISGIITDADTNEPLIGATVREVGGSGGSITDIDGKYSLTVKNDAKEIEVTYVGYDPKTVAIGPSNVVNVTLGAGKILEEVVVVGYGTKKKKDLTGAVASVSSKEFNPGNLTTPEQLVSGKIAGVQITSNGGAPGSGSRIRVRGGTSLNASNDPLIVIDGVPVDNGGLAGSPNPLSLINPNDIENITVLKDASAAAIYGARGANGVILITTKKGTDGGLNIEFNTVNSMGTVAKYLDVYTASEFKALIESVGTQQQKDLLGNSSTDWQKEIYRNALSSDNNLTLSGGVKGFPYRLNLGYLNQNGILKRSSMDRYSAGLNINPSFFNNQVKVNINAKYNFSNNLFADQGAIGSAARFDPTQSVYSGVDTLYGGYFEWLDNQGKPQLLSARNPLGLLYQKDDKSTVDRFLGSASIDYSIAQLPGVRLNLNLGTDRANGSGTVYVPATAASDFNRKGRNNTYESNKYNNLLEAFAHYSKEIASIHKLDASLGYTYQKWHNFSANRPDINALGDTIKVADPYPSESENVLLSFIGRVNYTLSEKYLFTFTLRNDNSSRFSPDTRSGWFPSAAFAWRIGSEKFLVNHTNLSDLKLRLGWGVTGQQDIYNDYPYIPNYNLGTSTAQVQFGGNYVSVLRPDAYDPKIKWEETTTVNAGIDYGFYDGRLSGSFDVYQKNTSDLLAIVATPAGTNFSDKILTNVGSISNKGFEAVINFKPIATKKTNLDFAFNYTLNKNQITKLNNVQDSTDVGVLTGGISGGTGNQVQIYSVGQSINTFYVYEQKIENGKPVEGTTLESFVDRNGDGIINSSDRYYHKNAEPQSFLGLNCNFNHGNLFGGFAMRASLGNYVYNNVASNLDYFSPSNGSIGYLSNIHHYYDATGFVKDPTAEQYLSDYYIEKASFLRMDNVSLGYNLTDLLHSKFKMSASFIVQNVFVVSKYKGMDPEIAGGIDNNIYPRPRTYSVALNFQF